MDNNYFITLFSLGILYVCILKAKIKPYYCPVHDTQQIFISWQWQLSVNLIASAVYGCVCAVIIETVASVIQVSLCSMRCAWEWKLLTVAC